MAEKPSHPFSFVTFLHELTALPEGERWTAVDRFISSLPSIPYIEKETVVHFLFRGDAASVTIPCDANDWSPSGFPMKRIDGTNFWYYTHHFDPDARIDYKFLIDGWCWILDPLNPHRCEGGFGPNSELRMPSYVPPPEIEYHPDIRHGTLTDVNIDSAILGNSRTIRVYTPPGYERTTDSYPVVCFHDGFDYLALGSAHNILDDLIARRRIAPVIAVFVPPIDRYVEYSGTQMHQFYAFIVDELLPFIDRTYRTKRTPADRATIGASNSGNMALLCGLSYPEVFGNVAAQSSNIVSAVVHGYENSPRLNLKFYLDIGTYDLVELMPVVQNFAQVIRSKGYPHVYWKYHGGHSWGSWRANLGRALKYFFPPRQKQFHRWRAQTRQAPNEVRTFN
jgi:enterochelin esterase-like enzyme